MLRLFWRNTLAPQLTRRLAPRIVELLSADEGFKARLARVEPPATPEPAETPVSQQVSSLQIFKGYEDGDIRVLEALAQPALLPDPGFITDFLGVKTRTSILYDAVRPLDGHVLGVPVPGDFHAEAVEWIGAMKTVLTAVDRYVAMEWGAGWAPWLVAGAKAAQSRGIKDIKLYAVEADPMHFKAIRQHFTDNGLDAKDHVLLQAAVGAESGTVQWPDEPDARNQWGARPVRDASDDDIDYLSNRVGRFVAVQLLEARKLLLSEPAWDMLHIDIQGWEGEVCRSCIDVLSERVKWAVIGVHSRILDAELMQLFHGAGWVLEHEKPTRFVYRRDRAAFDAMVAADGTQVWRNPNLVSQDDLSIAISDSHRSRAAQPPDPIRMNRESLMVSDPERHFTAHNIRLDDGTLTLPSMGPTMDQHPVTRAVRRVLSVLYPDGADGKTIIDVGCLEGGFTTEFARMGLHATGVEVRDSNYQNCLYVRDGVNLPNLTFIRGDANNISSYGEFDVHFVSGLLYHLDTPRKFLEDVARNCRKALILWTHVAQAEPNEASKTYNLSALAQNEGLRGRWYPEHEDIPADALNKLKWASWANRQSFWIQKEHLLHLLREIGFDLVFEQFDCMDDIANDMSGGFYHKIDRAMLVAVKSGLPPDPYPKLVDRPIVTGEEPKPTSPASDPNATSQRLEAAERELLKAHAELEAAHASTSWRITAPLRQIGRLLRPDGG